jgi:hypothetical protein
MYTTLQHLSRWSLQSFAPIFLIFIYPKNTIPHRRHNHSARLSTVDFLNQQKQSDLVHCECLGCASLMIALSELGYMMAMRDVVVGGERA